MAQGIGGQNDERLLTERRAWLLANVIDAERDATEPDATEPEQGKEVATGAREVVVHLTPELIIVFDEQNDSHPEKGAESNAQGCVTAASK